LGGEVLQSWVVSGFGDSGLPITPDGIVLFVSLGDVCSVGFFECAASQAAWNSSRVSGSALVCWHIDAAFAVHPDFRSHTGGVMTYGRGAVQSISRKQKLNTRSSIEAELVGADDGATMILWTKLFMEAQGYEITHNILYQDNKSAILLETNGKKSSSKRTRALNIRYFFGKQHKDL
jgi:hypothetical protein